MNLILEAWIEFLTSELGFDRVGINKEDENLSNVVHNIYWNDPLRAEVLFKNVYSYASDTHQLLIKLHLLASSGKPRYYDYDSASVEVDAYHPDAMNTVRKCWDTFFKKKHVIGFKRIFKALEENGLYISMRGSRGSIIREEQSQEVLCSIPYKSARVPVLFVGKDGTQDTHQTYPQYQLLVNGLHKKLIFNVRKVTKQNLKDMISICKEELPK